MSVTNKSVAFLAIAFAISWGITLGAHFGGLTETIPPGAILFLMMTGPAIAALICTFALEKGRRVDALGLRFRPNIWWLWAWLIPVALAAGSVIFTLVLTERTYMDVGEATIAAIAAQDPAQAEQMRAIPSLGLIIIGFAVTLGALINAPLLTITEELGWRGYLHHLWRPSGFWRASLATGFVWGLWHAPAVYFYGLNYPEYPAYGIGVFILWCMMVSPIMTLVRDRAGSTWAAGLFHGGINAVGGLTVAMINPPNFPWAGIVGIGGFVALAIGLGAVVVIRARGSSDEPALQNSAPAA